jgi:hypothetical protein
MPFPALQTLFDPLYPSGLQWYWRANFVKELSDPAIAKQLRPAGRDQEEVRSHELLPGEPEHSPGVALSGTQTWKRSPNRAGLNESHVRDWPGTVGQRLRKNISVKVKGGEDTRYL